MTRLFDVVLRLKPLQWQKILEDLRSIKGILSKVQLILFDGYTKEYCIATHLFARRVRDTGTDNSSGSRRSPP